MRVSVIIPTHNEAQAIGRVLADLPSDLVTGVIVVDGDSTDGTPEVVLPLSQRCMAAFLEGTGRVGKVIDERGGRSDVR